MSAGLQTGQEPSHRKVIGGLPVTHPNLALVLNMSESDPKLKVDLTFDVHLCFADCVADVRCWY